MPVIDNTNSLNCTTWRDHIIYDPNAIYPSPPASHETVMQEPLSSMDILCLPPFWETSRDSNLTIALINAQRSERRAESRLIRRRLKRVLIEQELYSHMEQHTSHRLRKADTSVGVSRGVFRASGLTPAGKIFDDVDSDVSSIMHDEADSS
ncbi:uncharacterized protein EDB93DRAFT_1247155 [Suillus bovinus]|uniref:uncharacterized protein n=1 Tax=Suillus bovinus TaxID=48563 RepID=UPI001B87283E|nr:uncharacterized protein EDB93DRAFT_1247155 [Suillus bovinus]KAG2156446.1 hypothetical protein EDB93DRAFT_1247155 [Suillus bovinus]